MEVLQRLNEAANTAWPFVEDSPLKGISGSYLDTLPNDAILDCHAVIYGYLRGKLQLVSVAVSTGPAFTATFVFAYTPAGGSPVYLTIGSVPGSSAWDSMEVYKGSVQYISTSDIRISLYVVFGRGVRTFCETDDAEGNTFLFNTPTMEPACIRAADKHFVRSCDSPSDVKLTGDIKIMPGYNMDVAVTLSSNTVRLSAEVGAGEGQPCEQLAPPAEADCADLVYFINGIGPDWRGAFKFMAGNGIDIVAHPESNKITFKTPYMACLPGCRDSRT